MPKIKAQVALEYMVLVAAVVVVFTCLFAGGYFTGITKNNANWKVRSDDGGTWGMARVISAAADQLQKGTKHVITDFRGADYAK